MLRDYQLQGIEFALKHKKCILAYGVGYGKTITALKIIEKLKIKTLVLGTKKIAQNTWHTEIDKWGLDLTYTKVLGTKKQKEKALLEDVDVYITNFETIRTIDIQHFDCIIFDELTKLGSSKSQLYKKVMKMKATYRIGLTGSLLDNGYDRLFSMIGSIDLGETFGTVKQRFLNTYFTPPSHRFGKWSCINVSDIRDKIKSICYIPEINLDLPINRIKCSIDIDLKLYNKMKIEGGIKINDDFIIAETETAKANKLIQLASGNVYMEGRTYNVHNDKLEYLKELLDEIDDNTIVFYNYLFERDALIDIGGVQINDTNIKDWNEGKIKLLIANPKSAGHGLNLQGGGHNIIFYSMNYDYELYKQAIGRLARSGQEHTVNVFHLLAKDTIDYILYELLNRKKYCANSFNSYLKEYLYSVKLK